MNPTIEQLLAMLAGQQQTCETLIPQIVCCVDGELICFNTEDDLKKFMWTERPTQVNRYNFVGEVVVPFELSTVNGPKAPRGPYKKEKADKSESESKE